MKLTDIDKSQYRERLNRIIIVFVIGFAALAVAFGSGLIAAFSDGEGSNFRFNLLGVILALVAMMAILHSLRTKPYFQEVVLVFDTKQGLNKIYRKLNKIKAQAKQGDVDALLLLDYYYRSYKVIYHLDDNTITMASFERDHQEVLEWAQQFNLSFEQEHQTPDLTLVDKF